MKSIFESIEFLLKGIVIWLRAVSQPAQSVYENVQVQDIDRRAASLMVIWLWSIALGILLQSPVMRIYGIELTDLGYMLPNTLLASLGIFILGAAVHPALLLFRLKSRFVDTFSIYVITVVVYSPIWTLMALPAQANNLMIMRRVKAQNLSFDDSIVQYFTESMRQADTPSVLTSIFGVAIPISQVSFFWAAAIFAACLAQNYGNPRFRTLLALSLGWIVGVLVMFIIVGPLNMLLAWGYVK